MELKTHEQEVAIFDLVVIHRPSGITGPMHEVMDKVCIWLHKNRPEQLCWMEGIFKDPTLNKPCPNRKKI